MRPDHVGLGGFDSHTFPPPGSARLSRVAAGLALLVTLVTTAAGAQVADSARVGPTPRPRPASLLDSSASARDSLARPPVSPPRALLQSLAVPGWGQASLHRSTAGALFTALEVTSVVMLIQSKKELSAARSAARDSVLDPATGTYTANPLAAVVRARRQAVEDWAALLIFNHLLSAADAFVAAHLWDVPVQVRGGRKGQSAMVTARIPF